MRSSARRPLTIWILIVLLLLLAIGSAYQLYEFVALMRYYSIDLRFYWTRYEIWATLISIVVSSMASVLIWRRSPAGRILAVTVIVINLIAGLVQSWRVLGSNKDFIDVASYIFTTILMFPVAYLCLHIFVSKKARRYFAVETFTARSTEPPPPPTFES